ncbi:STAS domain-containing protein [Mycolicibacillus parakoreensis]|uniref:STAS domain-containing protein n=1 Tax=Mycolicibacillus parakoreensis TaxID=1069221 RepID=A0ABY3TWF9_9MYCO|nr:STAS domain-containing protein [Mycolicibacillus parakoreensis]MCV7315537.1 STAS domain-containing protein [Mycolicibacillus parakoreensis]ULN52013.1 STAS domain-containing protein [Mycolicibacillus parakoreensis]
MTVTRTTGHPWPSPTTDIDFPAPSWESYTAQIDARWGRSGLVLTVHGEVDAANSEQLTDYVRRCAAHCEWLVLDLSGVDFMGSTGFVALQRIQTAVAGTLRWALVPGRAVSRLLRICDPGSALPARATMTEALAHVQDLALMRASG